MNMGYNSVSTKFLAVLYLISAMLASHRSFIKALVEKKWSGKIEI